MTTENEPSADFKLLRNEIKSKPSGFAIAGLMAGVIALPFALLIAWFPREIDTIDEQLKNFKGSLEEFGETVNNTDRNISRAISTSELVLTRIDNLIEAIARSDSGACSTPYNLYVSDEKAFLQTVLPSDVHDKLSEAGLLGLMRCSVFDSKKWVFVTQEDFSKFDSQSQAVVRSSFEASSVRFFVD